jgi:DNA-binding IclR family transcriptional regulator
VTAGAPPDRAENPTVKSARRVLEILELFDELQRDLTLTEIVRELGYPPSSTSALLRSLLELGYLTADERLHSYRPTARVTLLGSWINAEYFADGALHRVIEELNRRTGETIILAVQTGMSARYIHVVQGTNPMRLYVKPGAVRPLGFSGVGRLFLSLYPVEEQRRIVNRLNANRRPHEKAIDQCEILEDLRRINKVGYAVSADRVTPGAGILAALLPSSAGERPIAIGVGGRSEVIRKRQAEFAEEIRLAIGLHLPGPPSCARRRDGVARA